MLTGRLVNCNNFIKWMAMLSLRHNQHFIILSIKNWDMRIDDYKNKSIKKAEPFLTLPMNMKM